MKLGLVLECTQDGPDVHICKHLITLINQLHGTNIELARPVTLTNKPGLLQRCGSAVHQLLTTEGCDRVIIVWDLDPPNAHGRETCLGRDRKSIFSALDAAEVDKDKVKLVGIRREIESWLIADGRAIQQFLHQRTKRSVAVIRGVRKMEQEQNPKQWLARKFREHSGPTYNDYEHAKLLAKCIQDFRELRRSETFCRFVEKIADIKL